MDLEARTTINAELASGESILWAGRPRRGVVLTSADIFMIPFSLFWCGFIAFWFAAAIAQGASMGFLAFVHSPTHAFLRAHSRRA